MDSLNDLIWNDENLPDDGDVDPQGEMLIICMDAMSCNGMMFDACSKMPSVTPQACPIPSP